MSVEIIEPDKCPCCGSTLVKITDQLFCKNISCPEQVSGKLLHFCKTLSIKGMGPKTLEKLQLENIAEIFYLDIEEVTEVLGSKVANKLLEEIEKAKVADLATVIESFAIPLIGGTASKKLALVIGQIEDITEKTCKEAGLGDKATQNILEWLENEYPQLKEFLPFSFQKAVVAPEKTVCITGKLSSYKRKADAEGILRDNGFQLVDSVTKSLDYLVDEGDGTSAKRKKAEQYGIKIVTDLNDLLKVNN